jgi:hypothetical protein
VARETTTLKTGAVRSEPVVGLCRRSPTELPPEALWEAIRLHWTIENNVHWSRDVNWRADHSRVRTDAAPPVLARWRNAVLSGLDLKKKTRIASQRRVFAGDRHAAIAFVPEPIERRVIPPNPTPMLLTGRQRPVLYHATHPITDVVVSTMLQRHADNEGSRLICLIVAI